jgi:hypothetical protein
LVPLAKRSNQPFEVAVVMALAPELADDALVAECLAAQIDAYVATHSLTNVPHDAISRFLRSPHAAIRASGRRLAHAAYRARTGTVGTAATDLAA